MIITLCGSSRFEKQFIDWISWLGYEGHVVMGLTTTKEAYDGLNKKQKIRVDLNHLHKIMISDAIMVLNVDGYIGDSTEREIEWAVILGKKVIYLESSTNKFSFDMFKS